MRECVYGWLDDPWQTAIFAFIVRYGASEVREMLNPTLSPEEEKAAAAAAAAAGPGAMGVAGEMAAGRRAPRELEQLLELMLRWE